MIKWIKDKIIWFLFGGVALASGVALLPEKTITETIIQPVNVLSVKNPKQIKFTDDNTNETLIIKTDKEDYSGFNSADVWFSITSQKEETIAIKFLFEENKSSLEKLSKYNKEEITNFLPVYTNEKYNCDYIATTTTKELVKDTCERQIQTATTTETTYKDNWNEIGNTISIDKGTTFFKAFITYPKGTKEKFSIEAIGKSGSYGLLDPTIDGGTYTKYQEVTIDKDEVDADLTDFPVYVDLSDLVKVGDDLFDTCRSDGGDIRVTKTDGTTELPREVVAIDTSAKTGELHFKFTGTVSSTSDTVVRIYYNGTDTEPASDSTYGSENVWNSNYVAVYHMANSSGSITSSTSTSLSGTASGDPTYSQTGKIAESIDFDGTGDYFTTASSPITSGSFTLSAWCYPESITDETSIVDLSDSGSYPDVRELMLTAGKDNTSSDHTGYRFLVRKHASTAQVNLEAEIVANDVNQWHFYTGTFNNSTGEVIIYVDANNEDSETNTDLKGYSFSGATYMDVGTSAAKVRPLDGKLDEVRILSTNLSADWIATEYSNQNTPTTFYATSDEQGAVSRRIINIE